MNMDISNFHRAADAHGGAHEEQVSARWRRLYSAPGGGPLMGWLLDEAANKGMDFGGLAKELHVTMGYLSQLQSGIRDCAEITRDFARAAGVFLQVPAVVVLIVAGQLTLVDCVCATQFDRWVESTIGHEEGQPVHLACGAQVGVDELWLLPKMVEALHAATSVHATRTRVV